jgi:hypothetical protein
MGAADSNQKRNEMNVISPSFHKKTTCKKENALQSTAKRPEYRSSKVKLLEVPEFLGDNPIKIEDLIRQVSHSTGQTANSTGNTAECSQSLEHPVVRSTD